MNANIYNPYVRTEMELYHHGIAGQRWGKRNGPPYPLSAGAHSASEKKAGWRKSLDRSSGSTSTKRSTSRSSGVTKARTVKATGKKRVSRFTPEQKAKAKKVAITALKVAGAVAITAAAAYAGYKGVGLVRKAMYGGALKSAAKAQYGLKNAMRNEFGAQMRYNRLPAGHSKAKKAASIALRKAKSRTATKQAVFDAAKNRAYKLNKKGVDAVSRARYGLNNAWRGEVAAQKAYNALPTGHSRAKKAASIALRSAASKRKTKQAVYNAARKSSGWYY